MSEIWGISCPKNRRPKTTFSTT